MPRSVWAKYSQTHSQKAKEFIHVMFACMAARCKNMEALEAIVYDDISVVFYCHLNDDDLRYNHSSSVHVDDFVPLLHEVCRRYGWNDEIKFILKVVLENRDQSGGDSMHDHEGLFHKIDNLKVPLMLSMDAGADLDEVVDHLKEHYPAYLKANLIYVAEAVSQYLVEMDLLRDLTPWSDNTLLFSTHPRDGSSVLGLACCHHNHTMIHYLCHQYFTYYRSGEESFDTHSCLLRVRNHLSSLDNEGKSPLGHLLLCVRNADANFAWECINECVNFFSLWEDHYLEDERRISRPIKRFQFQILHIFLSQTWDENVRGKKYARIVSDVVGRLGINTFSVEEETGNTLLSIMIEKMAMSRTRTCTPYLNSSGKKKISPKEILSYRWEYFTSFCIQIQYTMLLPRIFPQ